MSSIDTMLEQELLREDHMDDLLDNPDIDNIDLIADTDPETADVEYDDQDEEDTLEYLEKNYDEEGEE